MDQDPGQRGISHPSFLSHLGAVFAAAQILTLMAGTSFGLLQFSRGRSGGVSGLLGTQPSGWASFGGCSGAEACSAGAAVPQTVCAQAGRGAVLAAATMASGQMGMGGLLSDSSSWPFVLKLCFSFCFR